MYIYIGIDPYPNDRKKKTTEKRGWQGVSLGMAKGWQKDRLRIQMAASKLNWNWLDLGAEMTLSTKTLNSNHQVVWQDGLLLTYCKDPQRSAQIATEKSDYFWMSRKIQLTINPMCSMYGIGAYGIGRTSRKMRRTSKNSSNIMTWRSGFIYNSSFYLCVCILKIVHIKEKNVSSSTYFLLDISLVLVGTMHWHSTTCWNDKNITNKNDNTWIKKHDKTMTTKWQHTQKTYTWQQNNNNNTKHEHHKTGMRNDKTEWQ